MIAVGNTLLSSYENIPFGVSTHVESVVCLTRRLDNELPMA